MLVRRQHKHTHTHVYILVCVGVCVFVILIANLMRPKQFLPHSVNVCVGHIICLHINTNTRIHPHTHTEGERATTRTSAMGKDKPIEEATEAKETPHWLFIDKTQPALALTTLRPHDARLTWFSLSHSVFLSPFYCVRILINDTRI